MHAFSFLMFIFTSIHILLNPYRCRDCHISQYVHCVLVFFKVCSSEAVATRVDSQVKLVIRPMYSNPPIHGAAIVATVLGDRYIYLYLW